MEAKHLQREFQPVKTARIKHLEQLFQLRKSGVEHHYLDALGSSDVIDVFFSGQNFRKALEGDIGQGKVFLIEDPLDHAVKGYFQFQYQEIAGDNGICHLISFAIDEEASYSGYFVDQLAAMEHHIQDAGCCRIKGVASEKEFIFLERMNYQMAAPKYRHTYSGVSVNFVPFVKVLFYPKL
ncbi:MAG: hypothetical protein OXC40_02505 [Proteobacteria bacterium]|nr:hypothetical protein [Pseudomonadota bacterium]